MAAQQIESQVVISALDRTRSVFQRATRYLRGLRKDTAGVSEETRDLDRALDKVGRNRAFDRIGDSAQRARRHLKSFGDDAERIGRRLGRGAGWLGGAAGIGGMFGASASWRDASDRIEAMSNTLKSLGADFKAQKLLAYDYVTTLLDVPNAMEGLRQSQKVFAQIELGRGRAVAALQNARPDVLNFIKGAANGEEAFDKMLISVRQLIAAGDQEGAGLLSEMLFGNREFVRFAAASQKEIDALLKRWEKFGPRVSQEGIAAVDAYKDSVDDLKAAWSGTWIEMAQQFSPSLTKLVEAVTALVIRLRDVDWSPVERTINAVADALNNITKSDVDEFLTRIEGTVKRIDGMVQAAGGWKVVAGLAASAYMMNKARGLLGIGGGGSGGGGGGPAVDFDGGGRKPGGWAAALFALATRWALPAAVTAGAVEAHRRENQARRELAPKNAALRARIRADREERRLQELDARHNRFGPTRRRGSPLPWMEDRRNPMDALTPLRVPRGSDSSAAWTREQEERWQRLQRANRDLALMEEDLKTATVQRRNILQGDIRRTREVIRQLLDELEKLKDKLQVTVGSHGGGRWGGSDPGNAYGVGGYAGGRGLAPAGFNPDAPIRLPEATRQALDRAEAAGNRARSSLTRAGGSRSWRNRNPGNLRYTDWTRSMGATGQDEKGFAIFPTEEIGARAHEALLFERDTPVVGQEGMPAYKDMLLGDAIRRYSPPSENNSEAYIRRAEKAAGVSRNTRLRDFTPEQRRKLLAGMREHEGWIPGQEAVGVTPAQAGDDLLAKHGIPRGKANLFSSGRREGAVGENLTTITTNGGQKFTVHKEAAPQFLGFLNELEASGYPVSSSGGYNPRRKRGGSSWSEHAFGNAIDINAADNPMQKGLKTDLPAGVSDMAAKYGLTWGGDWKGTKDPMHFEWAGVKPAEREPFRPAMREPFSSTANSIAELQGKGRVEVIVKPEGGTQVTGIRGQSEGHIALSTGVDNTGALRWRPGVGPASRGGVQ